MGHFFETAIETLYETKSYQSVTCISLENDISTVRTLRVIDCTLSFYLEICEIPRLFLQMRCHTLHCQLSRAINYTNHYFPEYHPFLFLWCPELARRFSDLWLLLLWPSRPAHVLGHFVFYWVIVIVICL